MAEYVMLSEYADDCGVNFLAIEAGILELGRRMNELCENARMNGYGWEALISRYLAVNAPELLSGLEFDCDWGMFSAYYNGADDEDRATQLCELLNGLLADEERLFGFLREHADEIEWD